MFLVEMARIREQLKAVEEKYEIAQSDLEETCKSFDVTKTEYENLEKELEILETEIQKSREQSTQKTLEKQNLENQIHLLQEQIHSAKQNETQYQERAVALDADIDKRKKEEQGYLEEQSQLEEKAAEFSRVQSQAQEAFKEIAIEIHNLEEAIESGKNEIIEILNQRASIKGKLQRYDTMMEQISIRKVALNQRNLTLRSEVAQLDASEEQYKTQKQEIEETIEKLIRQGNRCEDQIKKYQAEISRADTAVGK